MKKRKERILMGDVPSPVNPPPGCRFHPRCPFRRERCEEKRPELRELQTGHWTACHFAEEVQRDHSAQ